MQRHWIGVERDPGYAELARKRLASVDPGHFSEDIYVYPSRRDRPRVPFGKLLESGIIKVGQTIYFGRKSKVTARVRADGMINCRGMVGSIHQIGRKLMDAPCNGWEQWFVLDENGDKKPLNELRDAFLQSAK